ncbi:MAG: hypothetical protein F6K04_02065 [Leptolyngbya sp. SIO4C5]|nr:hypothetical protein [Leptolyngbya sp. SIO4C5]
MRNSFLLLLTTVGLLTVPASLPALAQRVINISPEVNDQGVAPETSISGQFDTANSAPVDVSSVRIYVNDADVTSRSTITASFFSYRPAQPLPPGTAQVRVEYQTTGGIRRAVAWEFAVQPPQVAAAITSVTHNAASSPLAAGANFLATVNATPGAEVTVLLIQDGQTVRSLPTQEVSSGVYVATLPVQPGTVINEGIVVGRLQRQGQLTYAAADRPATFSGTAAAVSEAPEVSETDPATETTTEAATPVTLQPSFTNYDDGDFVIGNSFTLEGQTQPSAAVQVKVTSNTAVLGPFSVGNTLVDRTVLADANGDFQVLVTPSLVSNGTRYQISATAVLDNQTSPTTELTLIQQ